MIALAVPAESLAVIWLIAGCYSKTASSPQATATSWKFRLANRH